MGSLLGILVTLIGVATALMIAGKFVGWLGIVIVEFFRRIISRRFEEKIEEPQWVLVPNSELIRLENAGCASAFRIDASYEWEAYDEDDRGKAVCVTDDYECAIDLRSVPRDKPLWIEVQCDDVYRLWNLGCTLAWKRIGGSDWDELPQSFRGWIFPRHIGGNYAIDLRTLPYGVPLCDE